MPAFHSVQSALAIRRQREINARRNSSLRNSNRKHSLSKDGRTKMFSRAQTKSLLDTKVVSDLTMFHLGVIFIVLGIIITIGRIIPANESGKMWDELLGVGILLSLIGCLLVFIHKMVSNDEEKKLAEYVKKQLSHSQRLVNMERGLTLPTGKKSKMEGVLQDHADDPHPFSKETRQSKKEPSPAPSCNSKKPSSSQLAQSGDAAAAFPDQNGVHCLLDDRGTDNEKVVLLTGEYKKQTVL